jgi:hypothetical protein
VSVILGHGENRRSVWGEAEDYVNSVLEQDDWPISSYPASKKLVMRLQSVPGKKPGWHPTRGGRRAATLRGLRHVARSAVLATKYQARMAMPAGGRSTRNAARPRSATTVTGSPGGGSRSSSSLRLLW